MKFQTNLTLGEFEELVRPKLKLFLSVDIVGSTEYKQQFQAGTTQDWLSLFLSFFTDFPQLLDAELAKKATQADLTPPPKVLLWKSLGDELIFTAEIRHRSSVACLLDAFRATLPLAMDNWRQNGNAGLPLKGAAWLAGFPVGNGEIPLFSPSPVRPGVSLTDGRDYIGPQVDTGFRVKEHASPRRLALSADLAWLLVSSGAKHLPLYYEGELPLKGVIKGRPYPVVWIDCAEPRPESNQPVALHHFHDDLLGRKPVNHDLLRAYLKHWFEEKKGTLPVPFIHTDPFEEFTPPPHYEQLRDAVVRELRDHFLAKASEEALPIEDEAGTTTPEDSDLFLSTLRKLLEDIDPPPS